MHKLVYGTYVFFLLLFVLYPVYYMQSNLAMRNIGLWFGIIYLKYFRDFLKTKTKNDEMRSNKKNLALHQCVGYIFIIYLLVVAVCFVVYNVYMFH